MMRHEIPNMDKGIQLSLSKTHNRDFNSGWQSEASWNNEAVEANVSRLRNISTPVSTLTPSGHFQVLLWNSIDKETVKRIDEL